jgi:hypothetical protein
MYAFLYELNFVYDNHLLASLFDLNDSISFARTSSRIHNQNLTNLSSSTRVQHINDVNFQFSYLLVFSMLASILSSIYAMYSDFIISRKTFFLKSAGPPRYYELTDLSKLSYLIIYAINISTRILIINISFQLILLLPVHVVFKLILFVVLIFFKPLLFSRFSIDYFMWQTYNIHIFRSVKLINNIITYFKFVSYYPMILNSKRGVDKMKNETKRFVISFSQILFDLIFISTTLGVNFCLKKLNSNDLRIYIYLMISALILYFVSNLLQYFTVCNDEYDWAGKFSNNRRPNLRADANL